MQLPEAAQPSNTKSSTNDEITSVAPPLRAEVERLTAELAVLREENQRLANLNDDKAAIIKAIALEGDELRARAEAAVYRQRSAEFRAQRIQLDAELKSRAESAEARVTALEAALKKTRTFIEYARYELKPGKATLGDQFPRREDADQVMAQIDATLISKDAK